MIIQGKIPGAHTPINVVVEEKKVLSVEPAGEGASYDLGGGLTSICVGGSLILKSTGLQALTLMEKA